MNDHHDADDEFDEDDDFDVDDKHEASDEDQSRKKRRCNLALYVERCDGMWTEYTSETGLTSRMTIVGRIDDPHQDYWGNFDEGEPGSAFHGKHAEIEFRTPIDLDWLKRIRDHLSDPEACGYVEVSKGVEPTPIEVNESSLSALALPPPEPMDPVHATILLDPPALGALRHLIVEAETRHRVPYATLTLSGSDIPTPKPFGSVHLMDLDVSKKRTYAIAKFSFSESRHVTRFRGRVRPPESRASDASGVSILLTESRYDVDTERGLVSPASCRGRVIYPGGMHDGIDVDISFSEFERDEYGNLPASAPFGDFRYYAGRTRFMSFDLRYHPDDVIPILIPALSHRPGCDVVLNVRVATAEDVLSSAKGDLSAHVVDYGFGIRQDLRKEE